MLILKLHIKIYNTKIKNLNKNKNIFPMISYVYHYIEILNIANLNLMKIHLTKIHIKTFSMWN